MTTIRGRAASGSRSSLPEVLTAARTPSAAERASASTVTLADETSVAAIMAALPDPASLPEGALVIVPGEASARGRSSLTRSVLAVFGRAKTVPRTHRCSALVARGYVDVGAAADESGADLAWGRAPRTSG